MATIQETRASNKGEETLNDKFRREVETKEKNHVNRSGKMEGLPAVLRPYVTIGVGDRSLP